MLGILLWQSTLKEKIVDVEKILKELAEILNIKPDEVLEKTKDDREDLIFEAEVFYGNDTNLNKEVEELLNNFKEEYLKEELFRKMQELHIFESKKDNEKSVEILKEINEINKKKEKI